MLIYVLSADMLPDDFVMSGYSIEEWSHYQDAHCKLHQDAIEFMALARLHGNVYDEHDFMTAFNIEESVGMNDYIFMTRYNE